MKLIFVRNNSWTSLIIRLVQGWREGKLIAPWSHVAVVLHGDTHVIDSFYQRGGISTPRTISSFLAGFKYNSGILEVPTNTDNEAVAYNWMLDQIGRKYGISELWGYFTGKNTCNEAEGINCFHFAAEALNKAGYNIDLDRVTCYRLLKLCKDVND